MARPPNRLREGDSIELTLTEQLADGDACASFEAQRVIVHGGFAPERVLARVTHVSKHKPLAHGVVRDLVEPHPQRRPAPCAHHESQTRAGCSGCPWMPIAPAGQQSLKSERLRQLGLSPDRWVSAPDAELGYRWSSKRVAQGPAGKLVLGSYVRGSHRIADMTTCLVDHPRIQTCAAELQRLANELRIAGYDERTRQGDLRYVWLKTNGEAVLVTLIAAREVTAQMRQLAQRLASAVGVAACVQSETGNAIRGRELITLRGATELAIELAGARVAIGPLGFLQPNPLLAARAYEDLCRDAAGAAVGGGLALDVYAGAGITTQLLRRTFVEVRANDLDQESAALLDVPARDAAAFLDEQRAAGAQPDLILCNPPRGGMGDAVTRTLIEIGPSRIHVMSCSPETLVRDLAALGARYTVTAIRAYDTLPQTPHIELVAWLIRNEPAAPTNPSA